MSEPAPRAYAHTRRDPAGDGWWNVSTSDGRHMFTCPSEEWAIGFQSGVEYGVDVGRREQLEELQKLARVATDVQALLRKSDG